MDEHQALGPGLSHGITSAVAGSPAIRPMPLLSCALMPMQADASFESSPISSHLMGDS